MEVHGLANPGSLRPHPAWGLNGPRRPSASMPGAARGAFWGRSDAPLLVSSADRARYASHVAATREGHQNGAIPSVAVGEPSRCAHAITAGVGVNRKMGEMGGGAGGHQGRGVEDTPAMSRRKCSAILLRGGASRDLGWDIGAPLPLPKPGPGGLAQVRRIALIRLLRPLVLNLVYQAMSPISARRIAASVGPTPGMLRSHV